MLIVLALSLYQQVMLLKTQHCRILNISSRMHHALAVQLIVELLQML
jgi:hypothetical protein